MPSVKNMLLAAAGAAGGDPLSVEDVFATHTYYGNSGVQAMTNGIDLSSEGGMVWVKSRASRSHAMMDTVRGTNSMIAPDTNGIAAASGQYITYNTNGFSIHNTNNDNYNNENYCSWTFRKAPKFFDIQSWSGNGTSGRAIGHNLGQTPGMIIVLCLNIAQNRVVWHKSLGSGKFLLMNETNSEVTNSAVFTTTSPTSSQFYVGDDYATNGTNANYIAYLFGDNSSGNGEFGPDEDKDIIKCGSSSGGNSDIDLGFEPQWLLIKPYTQTHNWMIFDHVRGFYTYDNDSKYLKADQSTGDTSDASIFRLPYGFNNDYLTTSQPFIYVAIRKGPMRFPDVAASMTNIFNIDTGSSNQNMGSKTFSSNFKPEFLMYKENYGDDAPAKISTDLLRGKFLETSGGQSASSNSYFIMDTMNGWAAGNQDSGDIAWLWKRAPGFFDCLAYKSTNTAGQRIKHNLGVIPEMIWIKNWGRSSQDWAVFHKDLNGGTNAEDYVLTLNQPYAEASVPAIFGGHNSYYPTAVDFEVGKNIRSSEYSDKYMCWLFASLDGISKVGSYTGNGGTGTTGNTQDIDCGFSNGAKFVMIKAREESSYSTGSWLYFDSLRGINSGNDPYFVFNDTANADNNSDEIDPLSSGFTVVQHSNGNTNVTGRKYIFWAIAA